MPANQREQGIPKIEGEDKCFGSRGSLRNSHHSRDWYPVKAESRNDSFVRRVDVVLDLSAWELDQPMGIGIRFLTHRPMYLGIMFHLTCHLCYVY